MNLELFAPEAQDNLLPCDGIVQDYGLIMETAQAEDYFQYFLQHLAWQQDEVYLYGKYYQTERKVVWYGDQHYRYHYSGMEKQAHLWDQRLYALKQQIEQRVHAQFNSCLANLYDNGTQGLGWHSDDEPSLQQKGYETVIASLSLGATRKFRFKHKSKAAQAEMLLHSGQLIVMRGETQRYWKHTLAKSMRVLSPRINLTFRYFFPRGTQSSKA